MAGTDVCTSAWGSFSVVWMLGKQNCYSHKCHGLLSPFRMGQVSHKFVFLTLQNSFDFTMRMFESSCVPNMKDLIGEPQTASRCKEKELVLQLYDATVL